MPPLRSLAVASILASLASACGSEGLECPATGAVLLSGVPEVESEWGPGCIDAESWTGDIRPANATWTVELARVDPNTNSNNSVHVSALPDGVAAVWGTELILIDGGGTELVRRTLRAGVDWSRFVATDQGQMVYTDQSGGTPEYRVLGPTGIEVWLRLLDVDTPVGTPTIALAADDTLWIGLPQFTADFEDVELEIQQWAVTGGMLSSVVLPGISAERIARDDAGRFLVINQALELFGADGTPITSIDLGTSFAAQVIGLDEGFIWAGRIDDLPTLTRIDGQGELVWQHALASGYANDDDYRSFVTSVARLPDGGVVAVGLEDTIVSEWPDSPLTRNTQPFVVALDPAGEPTWGERLAVSGRSTSVAVGSQGEVYVAGVAQATTPNEYGDAESMAWLRRYDP